jgi:hypothetical protein
MNNEIIKKLLARMNESEWVSGGVAVNVGWIIILNDMPFLQSRQKTISTKYKYETNSSSAGHGPWVTKVKIHHRRRKGEERKVKKSQQRIPSSSESNLLAI